jgi:hypothetical protein
VEEMGRMFSKSDLRDLSLILAIVMLLASFPSTPGFVVVSGPSHPELTVNICQPLQMFDRTSNTLLARRATIQPEFVLRDLGLTAPKMAGRPVDFRFAPDTPPPKLSV